MDSSPAEIKNYLKANNLQYTPISADEKDEIKTGLIESTVGQDATKVELLDFYKVKVTDVLDLIRSRRCYVKSSFAYVSTHDFISFLTTKHLEIIERGLKVRVCFNYYPFNDWPIFCALTIFHKLNGLVSMNWTL